MFGIGFFELCIIAVVALLFVGPKKLPHLMSQMGQFFVQIKRTSNEMRDALQAPYEEPPSHAKKTPERKTSDS